MRLPSPPSRRAASDASVDSAAAASVLGAAGEQGRAAVAVAERAAHPRVFPLRPAERPARPAVAPAPEAEPRRSHRAAIVAGAAGLALGALVTGLILGRPADSPAPAAQPPAASAPADPMPGGSGPLGPWQQLGHSRSFDPTFTAVAKDPRGVLLIGDSIASRVRTPLMDDLTAGHRAMSWDHWNGRPTHAAVDEIIALRTAGRLPRTIVVVSGSNDVFEPALLPAQVERLMAVVGDGVDVQWVLPHVERPATLAADAAHTRMLDDALRAAAANHPNLHLIDWPAYLAARTDAERATLVPDGVHPSPAGSTGLAALITAAFDGR